MIYRFDFLLRRRPLEGKNEFLSLADDHLNLSPLLYHVFSSFFYHIFFLQMENQPTSQTADLPPPPI